VQLHASPFPRKEALPSLCRELLLQYADLVSNRQSAQENLP
jgi:hypothetical protein